MDWKQIVSNIAPALGSALGGPIGGIATKFIADKLIGNPDATPEEVAQSIAAMSPSQLVELKNIDVEFSKFMAQNTADIIKMGYDDVANARDMNKALNDPVTKYLAVIVTCGFFGLLVLVIFYQIPQDSRGVLDIMIGALGAAWGSIINFYFGSSAGSKIKDILKK